MKFNRHILAQEYSIQVYYTGLQGQALKNRSKTGKKHKK